MALHRRLRFNRPMNARVPHSPDSQASAPGSAALLADIATGLAAGSDLAALLERFLAPIMQLAGAQAL